MMCLLFDCGAHPHLHWTTEGKIQGGGTAHEASAVLAIANQCLLVGNSGNEIAGLVPMAARPNRDPAATQATVLDGAMVAAMPFGAEAAVSLRLARARQCWSIRSRPQ
jgi:anaerobic selenocysteine-containing dehydrogenase